MTELLFAIAGMVIGLFSGFFGIGGGTITVPMLIAVFQGAGMHTDIAIRVALSTSLAVAFAGSLTASVRNLRHLAPYRNRILWMVAGSLSGTVAGVQAALLIPGSLLSKMLAVVLAAVAIRYLTEKPAISAGTSDPAGSDWVFVFPGILVGIFSGMTGLGGGVLLIPLLVHFWKVGQRESVMISSLVIIPTVVAGLIQWASVPSPVMPQGWVQVGFFSVTAGVPLIAGALAGGWLGAHLMHRTPSPLWKKFFAVFLLIVSVDLFLLH
ncbi:MAG: sulfite exporter TauE/SafE family protein [Bacteroidetes bacterium]|nr:sulfite exporter TauE/SafE family protein [Bacteroidota bacterium]